jgi:5-(carboxyamino)imidazole ribonucleotide synthase
MLNLLGETPSMESVLAVPGAHLHLYGKSPRPGRKLGHITLRADDAAALAARLRLLRTDRTLRDAGLPETPTTAAIRTVL